MVVNYFFSGYYGLIVSRPVPSFDEFTTLMGLIEIQEMEKRFIDVDPYGTEWRENS